MTASEMPSRTPFGLPFASGTGASRSTFGDTSSNNINFADGFPSAYSSPASAGGKYVTRADMNALGHLATNDLFYHKCGGVNSFDADFAARIGGYPKGAVLEYAYNGTLMRVYSAIDNNKINFTGATPTSEQAAAGITAGYIDGVNWLRCNVDEPVSGSQVLFSYETPMTSMFRIVTVPANGVFRVESDWTTARGTASTSAVDSISLQQYNNVYCVWIIDYGTTLPSAIESLVPKPDSDFTTEWNTGDWKCVYGSLGYYRVDSCIPYLVYSTLTSAIAIPGHYYGIRIYNPTQSFSYTSSGTTGTLTRIPYSFSSGTYMKLYVDVF